MASRNLVALLAQLRQSLASGAVLGGLRFEPRAFERLVVPVELQGVHHEGALPDRARLFAACIESLATPGEVARLLALAQASSLPADASALAASFLSGALAPRENPILKLVFAAQYEELLETRRGSSPQ